MMTLVFGGLALLFWGVVLGTGSDWRQALRELEGGAKIKSQDLVIAYAHWGIYWGCVFNAVICTGLAATARWWAVDRRKGGAVALPRPGRAAWMALVLILLLAGAVRWYRLDLSLYNDEAHNFRRYFSGYFQQRSDGSVRWREPSWGETLWLNKVGNNSTPFSTAARLSHAAALRFTGSAPGTVHEPGLRLPALLAGLTGLVVLWALVRRLLPGSFACWWVLLLGALHPWHVRYSSEARGYAVMMLGISLCLYFAQRAWEENRWRWWIAMGLAQFLAIWSFSGTLYYLVAFNGLLMLGWTWRTWRMRAGWSELSGPLLGMTVGAILTAPMMLPMLPQLLGALKANISIQGHMGAAWWRDLGGCLVAGVRWTDWDPGNPVNLAVSRFLEAQPWLWGVVAAAVILAVLGSVALFRARGVAPVVLLAGPLAVLIGWMAMGRQGNFIHLWYLLHVLPGWLVVLAASSALLGGPGWRWRGLVETGLMSLLLGSWLVMDHRFDQLGKENLRGVAEAVPKGALHAAAYSDVDIYDKDVVIMDRPVELEPLIDRARQEKRPFVVSFSRKVADPDFEKMFHRIESSGEFEKLATLWGQEEGQFTHYLYKLR